MTWSNFSCQHSFKGTAELVHLSVSMLMANAFFLFQWSEKYINMAHTIIGGEVYKSGEFSLSCMDRCNFASTGRPDLPRCGWTAHLCTAACLSDMCACSLNACKVLVVLVDALPLHSGDTFHWPTGGYDM